MHLDHQCFSKKQLHYFFVKILHCWDPNGTRINKESVIKARVSFVCLFVPNIFWNAYMPDPQGSSIMVRLF